MYWWIEANDLSFVCFCVHNTRNWPLVLSTIFFYSKENLFQAIYLWSFPCFSRTSTNLRSALPSSVSCPSLWNLQKSSLFRFYILELNQIGFLKPRLFLKDLQDLLQRNYWVSKILFIRWSYMFSFASLLWGRYDSIIISLSSGPLRHI